MSKRPAIITIGNFDGVHMGHRAILRTARRLADQHSGGRIVAATFDPFPTAILRPGSEPPRIASLDQRIESLLACQADDVLVLEPTPDLLGMKAGDFIQMLIRQHEAVGFVEGSDFRFGKKRRGDMTMLAEMGRDQDFAVALVPRVETTLSDQSLTPISSSLIRWLIGRGRVEDASTCLGRDFAIDARIVKGEQRGRTIGIPTINLDPDAYTHQIVPADGVYAGTAKLEGNGALIPAAISVGLKPTFGHDTLTIEAHLINFKTDHPDALYGQPVRLRFARWLRDQYPFPSVDALKSQLFRDIDRSRAAVNEHATSP